MFYFFLRRGEITKIPMFIFTGETSALDRPGLTYNVSKVNVRNTFYLQETERLLNPGCVGL